MLNYIKSAVSAVSSIAKSDIWGNMGNISKYIIVALIAVIIVLGGIIYFDKKEIENLQEQVNAGLVAIKYQNATIEANKAKNDELNKQLQRYIKQVKNNFAKVETPKADYKEAQNQCESFIDKLTEAYQE